MRTRKVAGVLGVVIALVIAAPGDVRAADRAPVALNDRTGASGSAAAETPDPWYASVWQKIRRAFGASDSSSANWVDADAGWGKSCGSRSCACCHSSTMGPQMSSKSFVHPAAVGSTEDVNGMYFRSARAIAQMNPGERDAVRKAIRRAIADGDAARARELIDASVAKAPAGR